MPHGKICYLEIPANRAEDSARFYSDIFGWKVRERGDGNLAFDDAGGVSGTWVKEGDRTPDERTRAYIMVDSITDSLKRIEEAGGKVVMGAGSAAGTDHRLAGAAHGHWAEHGGVCSFYRSGRQRVRALRRAKNIGTTAFDVA